MTFEVRIAGPDDVIPFADELSALRHANEVNITYLADNLKYPDPTDWVLCVATVHALWHTKADASAPPDYVLVPVEPTVEMLNECNNGPGQMVLTNREIWRAMLRAAPVTAPADRTPDAPADRVATDALRGIVKVMGPVVPSCCGCAHEWSEALRLAQYALASSPSPQPEQPTEARSDGNTWHGIEQPTSAEPVAKHEHKSAEAAQAAQAQIDAALIPMVKRATGRTIPDLTGIEHVCKYQMVVRPANRPPTASPAPDRAALADAGALATVASTFDMEEDAMLKLALDWAGKYHDFKRRALAAEARLAALPTVSEPTDRAALAAEAKALVTKYGDARQVAEGRGGRDDEEEAEEVCADLNAAIDRLAAPSDAGADVRDAAITA